MGTMAKQTDEALFADLYPELRKFAAVIGDDDMEPEDIVSEVVVATLQLTSLGELDDPGAYLRRAIVNRVTSLRRSLGTRRAKQPILRATESLAATDTYPIEMSGLLPEDPVDRALLWLTAIEGMPSHDAAEATGLSAAAVRKRLSRIRSCYGNTQEGDQS